MTKPAEDSSPPTSLSLDEDVEDLLAYRVMRKSLGYMLGVLGLVTAVLGAFGYSVIGSIQEATVELETKHAELMAQVAETQQLNAILRQQIAEQAIRLESELDLARRTGDTYQSIFVDQVAQLVHETASITAEARQVTRESEEARQLVDSELVRLDQTRDSVVQELRDLRASHLNYEQLVGSYGAVLDSVRGRVFGSWMVVTKEKSTTPLEGTGLSLRMATIRDDQMRDVVILATATDSVLYGPVHLPIGRRIEVRQGGASYSLTPRYTLEYWLGKDVAGVQVDRELPTGGE